MKFAFVICVLPLFVLMLFQRSASIVNVMPGQTVGVAPGVTLDVHSFDVQQREDGSASQYHVAGEVDGLAIEASVNHPAEIGDRWIAVGDFGVLLVSQSGLRLRMAAALAIGLLVLVWMKTGLKWMCVPGALFVVNWLGSSESFSFLNVLQGMWGFLLAGAIVLPFLALREGTFSWIDLVLECLLIVPLFMLNRGCDALPPALQSPFFIPHVGCYVFGYLFLVRAAFGRGLGLVRAGFAFMTTGLVIGAAWAQYCWGTWWSWDPKECWSLASWLAVGMSFCVREDLKAWMLRIGAALIVITFTWGNFAKTFSGMHTYASLHEEPLNNQIRS